jgi:hypothetical protein
MRQKRQEFQTNKSENSIDIKLRDLAARVEKLEQIVALEGLRDSSPLMNQDRKRGKGRPPGILQDELHKRTRTLVLWFETYWPEISEGLRAAHNEHDVALAFEGTKRHASYVFAPPFYEKPSFFSGQCHEFITGKPNRYRGNPRNLAAGMAGLPEISPKRSFDRCSKFAAACLPLGERVYRDYLQRNFPDRLARLLAAKESNEAAKILRGSRSKDPLIEHLLQNAGKVQFWLRCGVAGSHDLWERQEWKEEWQQKLDTWTNGL